MNPLLKVLCALTFILLLQQESHALSVSDDISLPYTEATTSGSDSSIRMPELPPLFLINKQEAGAQFISEFNRGTFQLLQKSRLVPKNFNFCKNLSLTEITIDHEAPVPLFIEGHALRQ